MSVLSRRVILIVIGVLGALAVWPFTEIILNNQSSFPSYLVFTLVQGAVFGLILGLFFGSSKGIIDKNSRQFLKGIITGGIIGLLGGILGGFLGQRILFILGERFFSSYYQREVLALPISRGLGLSVMGIFIGISEGVRARSLKKVGVGLLGGFIGGLIGGFLMEILNIYTQNIYSRLLGILLFSLLINFFYGIIEKRVSSGVLMLLNGDQKRKEFLINQKHLEIGKSRDCDITVVGSLENHHATIEEVKGELVIKGSSGNSPLIINDREVDRHVLKYEDVIKLGDVKMFYKHR